MANSQHVAILKQGGKIWNQWRQANPSEIPDLSGIEITIPLGQPPDALSNIDFSGANLTRTRLYGLSLWGSILTGADARSADFRGSNLSGADFSDADIRSAALNGAKIWRAKLRKTKLDGAKLYQADFTEAELADLILTGVDIRGAIFHSTTLSNVDFTSAGIGDTVFARVDLRSCRGLSECTHHAPSTIGIDTIYASHGAIPESFLKKAGLPDAFLAYAKSLIGTAIQFYSCFISYSREDQDFADRLYADLQARDVRCWYAPHDMRSGQKIHEQIDEAIRLHDRLLLVLSPHSMSSEWVKTEISKARKRELREGTYVLFPIRLASWAAIKKWECFDADAGKDSAREIREFPIPDFSNWKEHGAYRSALERLLDDLREGSPRGESSANGPRPT